MRSACKRAAFRRRILAARDLDQPADHFSHQAVVGDFTERPGRIRHPSRSTVTRSAMENTSSRWCDMYITATPGHTVAG